MLAPPTESHVQRASDNVYDGFRIVLGKSGEHREIDIVEQMVLFQDYSSTKYGPLHNYPNIPMSTPRLFERKIYGTINAHTRNYLQKKKIYWGNADIELLLSSFIKVHFLFEEPVRPSILA